MDQDEINDLRPRHRGTGHFGPRLYSNAQRPPQAKYRPFTERAVICAKYASTSFGPLTDAQIAFNVHDANLAVSLGVIFA